MSSVPPNPPGGMPLYPPPNPPYDSKTQWRMYRQQQRAAWRAQREAWKAQHHAWRGAYGGSGGHLPSIVGPLILIAIGVVWLLIYSGRVAADQFWGWYGHWWPVVLIVAGLAMLGEWVIDLRRPAPVYRRSGVFGILFLVVFLGICAAAWNHRQPFENWTWNGNDFFNFFGMPEHDSDQPALNQQIPANAEVHIEVPRGDVNVTAGDGPDLEVQAHEVAYAGSDSDAQKIFADEKTAITVNGSQVVVSSPGNDHGRVNLAVTVPKTVRVIVNSGSNDVTASGLGAGIDVTTRGDIHLNAINGPVVAHFINGRHDDVAMHQVNGDIKLEGDCNDLTLSEIKGSVMQSGQIMGDVHIENVSGAVQLHTSVTEVEIASLPGDMTLDSDDLHVNEATGAVRVTTHAKDVDLNQIYGDSYVQNRDGTISIEPAGAYAIEARNRKGDVEITLPPNAAGVVSGSTRNGDIMTDYGLSVSGDENKTVNGKIGTGGPAIALSADNGDLHIKKGPAFPSTPPAPEVSTTAPEQPGHVRHLRTMKALPPQPVTQ